MGQDKTQELLKEKLRGKGLKVTHQRLQVLSVLEENGGRHMTAEDIYELVSVDNPEIGLATVYRTLQLLLDMQLVDRIDFGDGCVRYEIGHLLTGSSLDIVNSLLDDLEEHIEKATGFHVLDHELKFYGLCSKCQKKENEEK